MAERSQTIIDKNNMTYVDGLAWDSFYRDGLVCGRRCGDMGLAFLEAASETIRSRLGADFVHPPDPLWSLGPDSREWQQPQTRLLIVGRSQAVDELMATELIREARILNGMVQSALSNL